MATSQYGLNNPLTVKLWARKLFQEALKQTWLYKFMGADSRSAIQILNDTSKGPGDRVRVGLRMQLSGNGVLGDGTLEGNEEALTTYTDDLVINQLRHAVRSDGKMSEQRIPFSIREEARQGLADWWADRIDKALFNQLEGNTDQTDTRFTGGNATVAPSSNNISYPNGLSSEASVASATTSNIFKLNYIDQAVEKAKTNSPLIRPLRVNGEDKFLIFLHPYQVTDLRQNTATGQWLDIQKAVYEGSRSNNPIYNGALGEYNGVIIHESSRIPSFSVGSAGAAVTAGGRIAVFCGAQAAGGALGEYNGVIIHESTRISVGNDAVTTDVARAVFCGAQAGAIAFGQGYAENKMAWVEELFDYGNQLGVSAGMIFGCKKMVFNSQDFGTVVIPTYAVAH